MARWRCFCGKEYQRADMKADEAERRWQLHWRENHADKDMHTKMPKPKKRKP